jgi:hypothetical protein
MRYTRGGCVGGCVGGCDGSVGGGGGWVWWVGVMGVVVGWV